ncbi:MAG: HAD family hydrolase [Candidatus Binatia bacterium]
MRYEHIVFDLDGTLIDSRADLAQAINHVRRALGLLELSLGVVTGYIGEGARILVKRSLGPAHADRLEEGLTLFMQYYGVHLLEHTQLYPGIAKMLSALAQHGAGLSVLSNKPEAMSRTILDGLGILSLFAVVLGGDSFPARKPDPAGLTYLRTLIGTAPERLLVVGDSRIDLDTARAGGIDFCGVAWGFGLAGLRATGAERTIEEPAQLLALVEGHKTDRSRL